MTDYGNVATGASRVERISAERCAELLRLMPKRLRHWLLYSAATSFSEEAVYQYYLRYGEETTLEKLRYDQKRETLTLYGCVITEGEFDERSNSGTGKVTSTRTRHRAQSAYHASLLSKPHWD